MYHLERLSVAINTRPLTICAIALLAWAPVIFIVMAVIAAVPEGVM